MRVDATKLNQMNAELFALAAPAGAPIDLDRRRSFDGDIARSVVEHWYRSIRYISTQR